MRGGADVVGAAAGGRDAKSPVGTRKREHSRKTLPSEVEGPDEFYDVTEAYSPGPRLELFAQGPREGWTAWGNQAEAYKIGWETYAHNSRVGAAEWA